MVDDGYQKGSLIDACSWYKQYLQTNIFNHWHLIAPALVGIEDNSHSPASGDFTVVFQYVLAVAKLLKRRRNLALVDIEDELVNEDFFKVFDDKRSIPNQVVFVTLGWLCKFSPHAFQFMSCSRRFG